LPSTASSSAQADFSAFASVAKTQKTEEVSVMADDVPEVVPYD
jgi:hypothetical protein